MKNIRALRRMLSNTDRVNDLLAATERLVQGVENQATAANERLDKLYKAFDRLASDLNLRLDRIIAAAENVSPARAPSS